MAWIKVELEGVAHGSKDCGGCPFLGFDPRYYNDVSCLLAGRFGWKHRPRKIRSDGRVRRLPDCIAAGMALGVEAKV